MNQNGKCIITAAVTGSDVVPSMAPYLPITPTEIADEAVRSAEAGAAVVHIHARNPKTGEPSSDLNLFGEILVSIKERTDAVICITTGGSPMMTLEERLQIVPRFRPEMATFNLGSMNYSLHFIAESFERRGKDFKYDWERPFIESGKSTIFKNSFSDLEYIAKTLGENDVKPECEIYDLGMLYNMAYLVSRGLITKPLQIQFVLGVLGGARAEIGVLNYLKSVADDLFGKEEFTWSALGAGYPMEFHLGAFSAILGGNIRVGMEDNLKIKKDQTARSNADLVAKAAKILVALDLEVATPEEARHILGLKGKDKVRF
jgi:uncharacterized protein (DUF849 family)